MHLQNNHISINPNCGCIKIVFIFWMMNDTLLFVFFFFKLIQYDCLFGFVFSIFYLWRVCKSHLILIHYLIGVCTRILYCVLRSFFIHELTRCKMKLIYTTTKICELANKRLDYLKSLFVEFISTEIRTLKKYRFFTNWNFHTKSNWFPNTLM